jgi:gamma-glutamyl hercynylcysteine S-oxide synthase
MARMDLEPGAYRSAQGEALGLLLMAQRNLLLLRLGDAPPAAALWWAAHSAWWQERWILRNLQRSRGSAAAQDGTALASVWPLADEWLEQSPPPGTPPAAPPPGVGLAEVRAYFADSLEAVLELLPTRSQSAAELHFFRAAFAQEAACIEAAAESYSSAQQALPSGEPSGPLPSPVRPALSCPAQRLEMGAGQGNAEAWVPPAEQGLESLAVPEFEIDAQVVNWAQYGEFAEDGGYDAPQFWGAEGWAWREAQQRQAPRGVVQWRGSVVAERAGRTQRLPGQAPVLHVSRFEAEAWCAWAGRRLPTEAEWQLTASSAAGRGFVWGQVWEWTLGSARAWPGAPAAPLAGLGPWPPGNGLGVLRGASWLTPHAAVLPSLRRFMPPGADHAFAGFRSCAV